MVGLAGRHQGDQRPGGLRGGAAGALVAAVFELVARRVLAPAAVGVLDRDQPVDGLADRHGGRVVPGGVQRAQCRPGAVDVIHAPAAVPAAVLLLVGEQVVDGPGERRAGLLGLAELGQHRDAARRDVGGRRIEQRAVVGERDVVEVVVGVVGVEGGETAVAALQALDPLAGPGDRLGVVRATLAGAEAGLRPVHRHRHHGGIVEVGIMGVVVLERPAAGTHVRLAGRPVALDVEHLEGLEPFEGGAGLALVVLAAGLHQGVGGERRVPDRGQAGLDVGLVLLDGDELLHRRAAVTTSGWSSGSRAPRTSAPSWRWPDRWRRARPRRSAAR